MLVNLKIYNKKYLNKNHYNNQNKYHYHNLIKFNSKNNKKISKNQFKTRISEKK